MPTEGAKTRLSVAWGFFAAMGVLTCLVSLWDMLVDCLEDFEKAERLYKYRLAPHHELLLVSYTEELFQSAIVLWVLTHYNVELKTASRFDWMNKTVYIMITDFLSVVFRIGGAMKKLLETLTDVWKRPKQQKTIIVVLDILAVLGLLGMLIAFAILKHKYK